MAAPSSSSAPPTAKMQQEGAPRSWYRDGFFLSTDKSYLEGAAVNAIFNSDLMWWNDPLEPGQMLKLLQNSLTFAVYSVPDSESDMKNNGGFPSDASLADLTLIGFARLVTDYVAFAYLTDVFILEAFQRRGLASWMMRAIKETVDSWPNLRGLLLMTDDKAAARMYQRELGALDYEKGPSAGLVLLEMPGNGVKDLPADHP